jgi:ribonuclease PH
MRKDRSFNQMREISFEKNVNIHADGSCLVKFGNTHVLCLATIDEKVPHWLKNTGKGWVTAEYGMLPRSTHTRSGREASRGKQSGRTLEIQRLIGRSLRSIIDLKVLGERQIIIDCDVIQADGGTRTASITGGWIALSYAVKKLIQINKLRSNPIIGQICAVSCGIWNGFSVLDLDYSEDSSAEVDTNFVITSDQKLVEIQISSESEPFEREKMNELTDLAIIGTSKIIDLQLKALNDS